MINIKKSYAGNLLFRVKDCLQRGEMEPRNIFCLGCAVKVPLKTILYPALRKVKKELSGRNIRIEIGNDAYIFESNNNINLNRRLYKIGLIKEKILKEIKKFRAQSAVLLSSYINPASSNEIVESLLDFFHVISKKELPFCIGKGHTIQVSKIPGQKFIMADYLTSKQGGYYGVANNDTIVTLDFNLKHSSWLNVYISLNNALNDLYALGVYKDITIYPVYDSIYASDNRLIKKNLTSYLYNFKKYNYNIIDFGPLGLEMELIGSTVVGFSDKELPRPFSLSPEQYLIVTRPVGDLSALVLYIVRQASGDLSDDIKKLKIDVLSRMATANIEIAKIISEYLPKKGKSFDLMRHITATKDISGEGLSAFEDLALKSKTDIYINKIKLHTEECSSLNVPNNTSNTNGPIIIAVHKRIVGEILKKLESIGCQPWIAGKVGSRNNKPTVYLKKELKKYPFIKNKSAKLFSSYKFI